METNFDNSLVNNSWSQITTKIGQLSELKNNPGSVHEMLTLVKELDSLLRVTEASKYKSSENQPSSKIAVVFPTVYTAVKSAVIENKEKEVIAEEIKESEAIASEPTPIVTSTPIESSETTIQENVADSIEKIKESENIAVESQAKPSIPEELSVEGTDKIEDLPQKEEEKESVYVAAPSTPSTLPTETISVKEETTNPKKQYSIWESYSSNEIPTLTHQNPVASSEKALDTADENTNTKLPDSTPLTPIKDMKKAISINDRYLFINELFRGDETGYERSLKTINNFNIYQEAKYWIDRELKLKMGWDENNAAVKQFNALVERRFA